VCSVLAPQLPFLDTSRWELGLLARAEDENLNDDAVLVVLVEFALDQQHRF
jgi:hypothetical protein